jgi:hypothetical protein
VRKLEYRFDVLFVFVSWSVKLCLAYTSCIDCCAFPSWQGYLPDLVKKGKKAKKPEGAASPPAKKIKA